MDAVKIGILALAAGRARRFGTDKRLARLESGERVLGAFLARAGASGLPILLCLGEQDSGLATEMASAGVACLLCRRAREGMGGTLAEGAARIPGWDGVLVALADMPWIQPETYRLLARSLATDGICVPVYRGQRGHPVGFGSAFFGELVRLGGDAGARSVLARHPGAIREVAVDDHAVLLDIDHPGDLGSVQTGPAGARYP